jgi:glycosyltransferase involved in cell wall biosynthesis
MGWRGEDRPYSYGGTVSRTGAVRHLDSSPHGERDGIAECDWIDGAAMLVRGDVFGTVGLLDERFFMYFEEADLCLRAAGPGWRIGVVLGAAAEQLPGGGKRPGSYQYLCTRNGLAFAWRVAGPRGLAITLSRRIVQGAGLLRARLDPRLSLSVRTLARVELAATWQGMVDFFLRRWGPPPPTLAGLGDLQATRPRHGGRCVIVSKFSPAPDGIAKYADQLALNYEGQGWVMRLGLPGSAADRVLRLDGGLRPLRLLRATHRNDQLLVMWNPWYYISGRTPQRIAAYFALGLVLRARRASVTIHEPIEVVLPGTDPLRRLARGLERAAQRWCWTSSAELLFHSRWEKEEMERRLGCTIAPQRISIVNPGEFYRPFTTASREQARQSLRIDWEGPVFVCLGFIARHKGFDSAVRAFSHLRRGCGRLYVVGSAPYESPHITEYLHELRALMAAVPDSCLIERFVDDVEFDLWIRAADAVVVTYRWSVSSSAVAARARVLGTPVVATGMAGIPEQLGPEDVLVNSDEDLVSALSRLCEGHRADTLKTAAARSVGQHA